MGFHCRVHVDHDSKGLQPGWYLPISIFMKLSKYHDSFENASLWSLPNLTVKKIKQILKIWVGNQNRFGLHTTFGSRLMNKRNLGLIVSKLRFSHSPVQSFVMYIFLETFESLLI